MAEQVVVPFAGDGAGEGDLSWGQLENWRAIVHLESWLPLGGVKPLEAGTTVADIADELAYLMGRYQSMRTRLRFAGDGTPTQIVYDSGEITLSVIDAGDEPPDDVAERVRRDYAQTGLDFETEWPVRMAVVRAHGILTHMVVLASHFVMDAAGAAVMMSEVARRETEPVTGLAPLDQARWQATPAGRRQNTAALRYWDNTLRTIDMHRFVHPAEPVTPRYWHGEINSPAMAPAIDTIVACTGVDSSTVVLGLFVAALESVTGINPVVVRPVVSNRFRPGLAGVVCTAAQGGLCVVDVAGLLFGDVVDRVQRAIMATYKYGYFQPTDLFELREKIDSERGGEVETGCYFNDRRSDEHKRRTQSAPDRPGETTFRWLASQDAPAFEPLEFQVEDVADTITMTIRIDAHHLSPTDAEALLRGMETTAIDAADHQAMAEMSPSS